MLFSSVLAEKRKREILVKARGALEDKFLLNSSVGFNEALVSA